VAEQSHKREMMDAVRGDFERLRARRERSREPVEQRPPQPERIILTPARPAASDESAAVVEPASEPSAAAPDPPARRSWPWNRRRRG
jgi:hypothetical protein